MYLNSNNKHRLTPIFMLFVLAILTACGGGGDTPATTASAPPGPQLMGGAIQTGTPLNLTQAVSTLAGASPGADGTGAAVRFNRPYTSVSDGTNLYVADSGNHTIRKIVIATGAVTTLAGTAGTRGAADGTGAAASFITPYGARS